MSRTDAFFDRLVSKPRAELYVYVFVAAFSAPVRLLLQAGRTYRSRKS